MPSTSRPASSRLFFALRPDRLTRDAIWAATRVPRINSAGRAVLKHDLHLTLAFLGNVPLAAVDEIIDAASNIKADVLPLRLNTLGHFEQARALWLGPSAPPPALEALARQLWRRMEALSWRCRPEHWRPHVTLVRGGRRPPSHADIGRVDWQVTGFGLYRSVPEAVPRYQAVAEWPLQGDLPDSQG